MQRALRVTASVLPGHKIEIADPDLREGASVEVVVFLAEANGVAPPVPRPKSALMDFLAALPPGPRSYQTWGKIEAEFQRERDSWER